MERYKEAAEALAQLQMSDCPIRTLALQVGIELSLVFQERFWIGKH
jgi:hypothetical protein